MATEAEKKGPDPKPDTNPQEQAKREAQAAAAAAADEETSKEKKSFTGVEVICKEPVYTEQGALRKKGERFVYQLEDGTKLPKALVPVEQIKAVDSKSGKDGK